MSSDPGSPADPRLDRGLARWATATALGRVLDLDPAALRDDSPLADLGADSVARIAFADAVEDALVGRGVAATVDDVPLRDAVVVGDLVTAVVQGAAASPPGVRPEAQRGGDEA